MISQRQKYLIKKWNPAIPVLELSDEDIKERLATILESQPTYTTFQKIKNLLRKKKTLKIKVM